MGKHNTYLMEFLVRNSMRYSILVLTVIIRLYKEVRKYERDWHKCIIISVIIIISTIY